MQSQLCLLLLAVAGGQVAGANDKQLDTVQLAAELYDGGEFEDAALLLDAVSSSTLDETSKPLFDHYQPLIRRAAASVAAARHDLVAANAALNQRQLDEARRKIADIVASDFAPPDLKQDARSLLSMVQFRARQSELTVDLADPGDDRAERFHQARVRLTQAGQAMEARDWQSAQDDYSLASWYWPEAELETVYVDPQDGAVFTNMPATRLHSSEILVPVRNVTMNLQLGVGRLVGMETFQFSGAPVAGVGAGGFVQLPSVQRVQIKTTVTAPAVEVRPQTIQKIEVTTRYVVLVRPKL